MSVYAMTESGLKKIAGLYRGEDISHATESHAGIIELATQAEVNDGTDDLKAITPLKAKTRYGGKMQIDYFGNKVFQIGDTALNFKDIHDLLLESNDFVFVLYGNRAYLCSYLKDDEGQMQEIRFESTINEDNRVKTSGIYIISSDGISITNVTVSNINSENVSNKATTIVGNETSDTKYPTTKAVNEYLIGLYDTKADKKDTERRLTNLEYASKGILYRDEIDDTEAYSKTVPVDAMPYAILDNIGGKSISLDQNGKPTLISADIVNIISRGQNESKISELAVHDIIRKYFPDGMRSAGTAHDVFDIENGIAIKNIGSVLVYGTYEISQNALRMSSVDRKYANGNYNIQIAEYPTYTTRHSTTSNMSDGGLLYNIDKHLFVNGGSSAFYIRDTSLTTTEDYINALGNSEIYYELENPIIIQIDKKDIEALKYIQVEAGGTLTFEQDYNNLSVPNKETFLIKTGGTV